MVSVKRVKFVVFRLNLELLQDIISMEFQPVDSKSSTVSARMQNTLNGSQLELCFGEHNVSLNIKVLTYLRQNMAAFEKRMILVLLTCFECERAEFCIKKHDFNSVLI